MIAHIRQTQAPLGNSRQPKRGLLATFLSSLNFLLSCYDSVCVPEPTRLRGRDRRIWRVRPIYTHKILFCGRQKLATRHRDLELRLLLLPNQQIGSQIDHAPLQMLLQERHHMLGLEIRDRLDISVADQALAALASLKIVVQDRGQRHDVLDQNVIFLILCATRAPRVQTAGEDSGEAGFVLLRHIALWLIVFDMPDE
jgi:hypothetical protein